MADIIQANYEQLEQIARRFKSQAESSQQMQQQVKKAAQVLIGGQWQGLGAQAFTQEMESEVMPALQRLIQALSQSSSVTMQIAQTLRQAEEEAAALFKGQGGAGGADGDSGAGGSSPDGGYAGGGSGGGGGGSWGGEGGSGEGGGPNIKFKGNGKLWQYDDAAGKGKFEPSIRGRWGVEGAVYDDGTVSALKGSVGLQAGFGPKGFSLGPYAEGHVARIAGEGTVLGDKNFGLTLGGEGKVLAADAFAGIKDNSIGATIGGTLVSVKGEVGTNIAGVNVGVNAEVGLKAELGFQIGKETKIKLPFVTIGFSFGGAKK